ncbi:MAG: ANTAR domain-containing protein [Clostridiales bacterium]|nr:ANTAR domain-containing protein [Clostridiales bacterium]
MKNIVLACKPEQINIKLQPVLSQQGFWVESVCSNASALLSTAQKMQYGVAVCTNFKDIPSLALPELLPRGFSLILLLSSGQFVPQGSSNLLTINLPLKRDDFITAVKLLAISSSQDLYGIEPKAEDDEKIILNAKKILMSRYNMSESDAHRFIQKKSMDCSVKLVDMARFVLAD